MPVAFDWEFQEQDPDPSREPERGIGGPDKRRHLRVWVIVLAALVIIIGFTGGGWIKRRLDAAEKMDAELRAVVELELRTIADGDVELFRSLQDTSDARWESWQIARYIGRPQNLTPLPGLTLDERPAEIAGVRAFGSLGEAELVHRFKTSDETQIDAVPFRTTWFYRRDEAGVWHHVAPPDDYSGVPFSWYGSRLVIRASEFESPLLDAIALDLVRLVYRGCERLGCDIDTRYTLSFEGELAPKIEDDWWTLPALHLVGLPEGASARGDWERALKLWMIDTLARSQIGEGGTEDRMIFHQLVERLQADLGIIEEQTGDSILLDVPLLAAALQDGMPLGLQTLWEAEVDSEDVQTKRQLENAVVALLQWIEGKVGNEAFYELIPALEQYPRLDSALTATLGNAPSELEGEWADYLANLTGVETVVTSMARTSTEMLEAPQLPRQRAVPGDQLAFICDSVVLAGNVDGSRLAEVTPNNLRFDNVRWSPDGQSLLTVWRHNFDASALYLLRADGRAGRLLTDDRALSVYPAGWSPDGDEIVFSAWRVFYPWRSTSASSRELQIWSVDAKTGELQQLRSLPMWSPDGSKLVFFDSEEDGRGVSAWLAGADWEDPREIVRGVKAGPMGVWSPDGTKLALVVLEHGSDTQAVVIYDVETDRTSRLVTATSLTEVVLSSRDERSIGGVDEDVLRQYPFQALLPLGWSSDGRRLVVWAQGATQGPEVRVMSAHVVVALDGSDPQVVAKGVNAVYGGSSWSSSNPNQLTFSWQSDERGAELRAHLFDLQRGVIYTATNSLGGEWSPDGRWVGFAGDDGVSIVDHEGQTRVVLKPGEKCSDIAWNPAVDLSALTQPISFALSSTTDDWSFDKVRLEHDSFGRILHVWGEVLNESGAEQQIIAFVPVLRHHNGDLVNLARWSFLHGYSDVIQTVSLAHGQSLPFGFRVELPDDVQLLDGAEIAVHVAAEPAEPDRDDLDIPADDFQFLQSGGLRVSGVVANAGPALQDALRIVVTAYDDQGRVMGWGWRSERSHTRLSAKSQGFHVSVQFSKPITDLGLEVESYKIQLFAR